jgi:hypothetical protein
MFRNDLCRKYKFGDVRQIVLRLLSSDVSVFSFLNLNFAQNMSFRLGAPKRNRLSNFALLDFGAEKAIRQKFKNLTQRRR